jgi:phage tail sheath protein FI
MSEIKKPGIYIEEQNAFPNSVIEVASAIPAFVGYTEKASYKEKSLINKPIKIGSLNDFHVFFGGPPLPQFSIEKVTDQSSADLVSHGQFYQIKQSDIRYLLYSSILLFFQNGGSSCFIVSVGDYKSPIVASSFISGIITLEKEQEPTLLLIPETILLPDSDTCATVQKEMLRHCGEVMKNRVAILDLFDGYKAQNDFTGNPVKSFREKTGTDNLSYGAAYYPWLNTSIVKTSDLGIANISSAETLQEILKNELNQKGIKDDDPKYKLVHDDIDKIKESNLSDSDQTRLNQTFYQIGQAFRSIIQSIQQQLNLLPPSPALAGIYTSSDNSEGVWKAPANMSLASVISLSVSIGDKEQGDLNSPLDGKAINAIRSFTGEGVLIWGARTLDANSQDWRYINVRRTIIVLEQSIKLACRTYVFASNDAQTWTSVKSMISNFLTNFWKSGGLVGPSPNDAFQVSVGLGETMTAQDILEGLMKVVVKVAILRPAEFMIISIEQQMQRA